MKLKWTHSMITLLIICMSNNLMANCGDCEAIVMEEDIQDFYLPENGLKVILKEEHSAPIIGMSLFYNVGSHDEPEGSKGITKLMSYIFNEADNINGISSEDRAQSIKELTRSASRYTSHDLFSITYEFGRDHLRAMLQIEADRMHLLNITDSSIVRSKQKLKGSREDVYGKGTFQELKLLDTAQKGRNHPYAYSDFGDISQIDTLSVPAIKAFQEKYFNPNNAVLVIVGDISPMQTAGLVHELFSGIENKSSVPIDPDFIDSQPPHILHRDKEAFGEDGDGAYGSYIKTMIDIPSYRNPDMLILKHLIDILKYDTGLGGHYFTNYIKKWGFFTKIDIKEYMGPSWIRFNTVNLFKKGSDSKIKEGFKKMITDLSENGFDETLLNRYKKRELIADYKKEYRYKNIAWNLGKAELILGDYRHYNRSTKILEQLSNDDIKRVASQYLLNHNIYTVEHRLGTKAWFTPLMRLLLGIFKPLIILGMTDGSMLPDDDKEYSP